MNNLYFIISKLFAPLLNPINFLIICIIILQLLNIKKKNLIIKNLNKFFLITLFFIGILPIGNIGLKFLEKDYLNQYEFNKVDNIIVLGGTFNTYNSLKTNKIDLTNQSERLTASIKLSLEFPNSNIYFVGGDAGLIRQDKNEIDIAKDFYKEIGFDLNRIEFVSNSRNTIESFKSLKNLNLVSKNNIIITSAFHMKRSLLISNQYGLKLIPYAVDFRSISTPSLLNKYQYFDIVGNFNKFNIFIREILGIVAFKLL